LAIFAKETSGAAGEIKGAAGVSDDRALGNVPGITRAGRRERDRQAIEFDDARAVPTVAGGVLHKFGAEGMSGDGRDELIEDEEGIWIQEIVGMHRRERQDRQVECVRAGRFGLERELSEFAAIVVVLAIADGEKADSAQSHIGGRFPLDVVNEIERLAIDEVSPGGIVEVVLSILAE
jgi:hypothetical protein